MPPDLQSGPFGRSGTSPRGQSAPPPIGGLGSASRQSSTSDPVDLAIYDPLGRLARRAIAGEHGGAVHSIGSGIVVTMRRDWDPASIVLQAGGERREAKIIVLR